MDVTNIKDRLAKLDSDKLIKLVKNYKQYGYPADLRDYVLTLLAQRGITTEDLRLTGNLENPTYEYANSLFSTYRLCSLTAFISYCLGLFTTVLLIYHLVTPGSITSLILIISLPVYFIFLIRSFLLQSDFYKLTGDDFSSLGIWLYLILGMPLYIIMYFIFRKQMKERMSLIE